MTDSQKTSSVEQTIAAIFALDLEPIKRKLTDRNEGHGWPRAKADRLELEYKRYLALLVRHPDEVIAPDRDTDTFWHAHILDTMKYARDCDKVFGHFLHHYPYFGMRGEEDAANLARAAQNMRRLYRQEFGLEQGAAGSAGETAYCAHAPESMASDTAYCARAAERGPADTAYCARAR